MEILKTAIFNWLLLLFFLLCSKVAMAQKDRFLFSIEYAPNLSNITNILISTQPKLSHNAFARVEYKVNPHIYPTIAMGFLNTGYQNFRNLNGELDIENIRFIDNHNYIIVPIGLRIVLGKFYFLPEIGFGYKISNIIKSITNYSDGTRSVIKQNEYSSSHVSYNRVTIPLFLSIGRTFDLGGLKFWAGLKGYYGLNKMVHNVPNNNHFYGIGLSVGLRFGN